MIANLLTSLLVSALTATLAFVAAHAWRRWHLTRLRQRCSLDGSFIAEYGQEQGGEMVMQRALTQISQIGLRVRAVTHELGSDRCWELNGEIDRFGFLRGTEKTRGVDSAGSTSVLLAISAGGDALTGLWSSCDATQRQVSSGQYAMRRCDPAELPNAETRESSRQRQTQPEVYWS